MNGLFDSSRSENTGEHSWHAAISAALLSRYANFPINLDNVIQMLLIHDLVEIEAGDTFVYDQAGVSQQRETEWGAADLVFSRLPDQVSRTIRALWEEFEARRSPEAKYAKAIDRFLPLYSNLHNSGFSWQGHNITQAWSEKPAKLFRMALMFYEIWQRK